MTKNEARWNIIQRVNKFTMDEHSKRVRNDDNENPLPKINVLSLKGFKPTILGMKQIQLAVNIARRNKLVDNKTLMEAKYNGIHN